MRIISEFKAGPWKFTVFVHQFKHTLKVRDGSFEQTYPLEAPPDQNLSDFCTQPQMLDKFAKVFSLMRSLPLAQSNTLSDEWDDEII